MAKYRQVNTDYSGGLQGEHLRGRLDIKKYNSGLQRIENFLPTVQGPVQFRPGTKYVADEASGDVVLIGFTINDENRYIVALSSTATGGVINVYSSSGVLLYTRTADADNDPLPWKGEEIYDVRWSQEVDTLVLTHPNYQPFVLSANTVFERVRLYSTESWTVVQDSDLDKISGDYANVGTLNGEYQFSFTNGDSDVLYLEYSSANTRWEIRNDTTATVLFAANEGVYRSKVPQFGWFAVNGVGANPRLFTTESTKLGLNDSSSTELYAGSIGSENRTPWTFEKMSFTSHPFQNTDTSDTVMSLLEDSIVEVIRLESDQADFGDAVTASSSNPNGLEDQAVYVEYKVKNQWGLARIIDSNYSSDYPGPTSTACYAIPETKVVNVSDPVVRLGMIIGSNTKNWMAEDGVPDDEAHVRADSLIFQTSNIGAWIRVGGSKLLTNVCDPVGSPSFNSQDGKIRWGKIIDYRGVEDHPVDFLYAPAEEDFDSGNVYQIYEWGTAVDALSIFDGTGNDKTDRSAFAAEDGGTSRFTMNVRIRQGGTYDDTTGIADLGTPTGLIAADMSNQRQFDVVEVDQDTLRVQDTDLITPSGNISVYDLTNDPQGIATHRGTIKTSTELFSQTRDYGRYILGDMIDKWVLFQIPTELEDNSAFLSATTVSVKILSSVSRDALTGELINNGVFQGFRMGAWYAGNWPYTVAYYEQRRVFAGSNFDPNKIWLSKLDDITDFRTVEDDGLVLDTTGITYPLGTSSTIIRWLSSGPTLVIGTESNEWQLRPNEFSSAISPKNIRIVQETPIGSTLQGQRVGASVFFPDISGRRLIEFKFDFQSQQFVVSTTTKLVPDLFDSAKIIGIAYQHNPHACFWIIDELGALYTLTYRKEDDYYAWAKHPISGTAKSLAVLPKGDPVTGEDQLWIIIERDGVNCLECLSSTWSEYYNMLDSYLLSTSETDIASVTVPDRLVIDGKVRMVADGVDQGDITVTAGNVAAVPVSATHVIVGLPYTGVLQNNPLGFPMERGNSYGSITRVVTMQPYVYKSCAYKVGVDETQLDLIDPVNDDNTLYTGFMGPHMVRDTLFDRGISPLIVQDKAENLTVVSVVYEVEAGED